MSMTAERVAARVAELTDSILNGSSHAYAQHNATQAMDYIWQVFELGVINRAQLYTLVAAVERATNDWQSQLNADGLPLDAANDTDVD